MKPEYKKYVIGFWALFALGALSVFLFFFLLSEGKLGYMPSFTELENPKNNLATDIYSSDGVLLGKFYIENRSEVTYDELAPDLVRALVATEDERFYEHSGIDVHGLYRVLGKTVILHQKGSGGGSTITQQLAKMLFHDKGAKNLKERFMQKLKEWVISVKLERSYTKEEILAMYLNRVGFVYDAWGIESASWTFFGKKVGDLKTEEAAVLVGMLKNPALFNPVRRPESVTQRRNVVLGQMLKQKYLTQKECDSLKALPLQLDFRRSDHKDGLAPYLREMLRLQLKAKKPERKNYAKWQDQEFHDDSLQWERNPLYGWIEKTTKTDGSHYDLYRDGLKIYTTIDSRMQRYAEEAVEEHIGKNLQPLFFKDKKGQKFAPFAKNLSNDQYQDIMLRAMKNTDRWRAMKKNGKSEADMVAEMKKAVDMKVYSWKGELDTVMSPYDSIVYHKHFLRTGFMAMNPHNGHVLAYVGGTNFRYFQYDMVAKGRRQVGSTIKPFIYTKAMREGYTPCDLAPNTPQTFSVISNGAPSTWTPRNAGNERIGEMVSLKWGLANSNNNVTAWVMKQFDPKSVADMIHGMGVESKIDPVPSLCLGTSEIRLYEMVAAYTSYANRGVRSEPLFVERIEDRYGNVVGSFKSMSTQTLDEMTAYLMVNLLEGVVNQGTARRLRGPAYRLTCQVGGKTGTTQNQSDAWFMALLPNLVSGVWVGGEDRSIHFNSMQIGQASNAALPVFGRFINKVFADESLTDVRPTDVFSKPGVINFTLDCTDKNINADEGDGYEGDDDDEIVSSDAEEGAGVFNF